MALDHAKLSAIPKNAVTAQHLTDAGCPQELIDFAKKQGIPFAGLLQWLIQYGVSSLPALMALIALFGGTPVVP